MSTQTDNLHLVKPADGEIADIGVINSNMDIIDAAVADKVDATDMDVGFFIPTAAAQIFQISFRCKNANNSHSGHWMTFVLTDSGMLLWDNSTSSTVWTK